MKGITQALMSLGLAASLAACSGDNFEGVVVNPSAPDEVSKTLSPSIGGSNVVRKLVGDLPTPDVSEDVLKVDFSGSAEAVVDGGSSLAKDLNVDSDQAVSQLLMKVVGAADFFEFDVVSSGKAVRPFNFLLPIPRNYGNGRFCVVFAARNVAGQVSQPSRPQCVIVKALVSQPASQAPTATPIPTASTTPATQAPTAMPTTAPSSAPTAAPSSAPTAMPTAAPTAAPTSNPTAAPTATPTAGGSASACFNEQLLSPGTRVVQSFRSSNSQGTVDFTDDRTVTGSTTFEGMPAIESVGSGPSDVSAGGFEAQSDAETKAYSQIDSNIPQIKSLGAVTDSTTQTQGITVVTNSRSVFNPPRIDRYNLDQGDSYTQTYTVDTATTVTTAGFATTNNSSVATELTRTYVSRQQVTVPAGTFDTCNFQDFASTTVNGETDTSVTDQYFDVGSGILIRAESGDTTTELLSATINGAAIQ